MLFIGLIVAIVLLVMLFLPTRRRTQRLLDSVDSVDADADGDAKVLANLQRHGSNLALPHAVDFFLYLPRWDDAARIKALLEAEGFAVIVGPYQAQWSCRATKQLVPTRESIAALRARLEALAIPVGGVLDGWGAPITR